MTLQTDVQMDTRTDGWRGGTGWWGVVDVSQYPCFSFKKAQVSTYAMG